MYARRFAIAGVPSGRAPNATTLAVNASAAAPLNTGFFCAFAAPNEVVAIRMKNRRRRITFRGNQPPSRTVFQVDLLETNFAIVRCSTISVGDMALPLAGPGIMLREERLRKGLSLEEISRQTRISPRSLEAIEGQSFDRLPGVVF